MYAIWELRGDGSRMVLVGASGLVPGGGEAQAGRNGVDRSYWRVCTTATMCKERRCDSWGPLAVGLDGER